MKDQTRKIFVFLFVAGLLAAGWFTFLRLVTPPPIENSAVLIMVWGTILVLLLAAFPQILNRVSKLKIGDFELELHEAIQESVGSNSLTAGDLETQLLFIDKEPLGQIDRVVSSVLSRPQKTIVFIVNVYGHRVSVTALVSYIYLLNLLGKSILVVFVNKPIEEYEHENKDRSVPISAVMGAIQGNKVIDQLIIRFPLVFNRLNEAAMEFRENNINLNMLNIFKLIDRIKDFHQDNFIDSHSVGPEDIQRWFGNDLNTRTISKVLDQKDINTIKESMRSTDDYVLVAEQGTLVSVVPLCDATRNFTSRLLK